MQESFKARLQAGQAADGCFLEMFNSIAAEIVAQAGFDSVLIDLEHGPGSVLDAIGLIHAVQGSDCAVLLRVEENHPVPIKRALDIGLSGLMVPAVSSRAEAEACVASCRYAPRGHRGMAAPVVPIHEASTVPMSNAMFLLPTNTAKPVSRANRSGPPSSVTKPGQF